MFDLLKVGSGGEVSVGSQLHLEVELRDVWLAEVFSLLDEVMVLG